MQKIHTNRGVHSKDIIFYVDINNCHICTSHSKSKNGYPNMYIKEKQWKISRFVYTQKYGEIPKGMIIRHTCDNRACINIEHLLIGTPADNALDRKQRNRGCRLHGVLNPSCKLSEKQVIEIFYSKKRHKEIAKEFGIHKGTVSHIKTKRVWKTFLKNL